jgi:hypothetical protein
MVDLKATGAFMSVTASDGFYTPAPDDVPRHSRWPWVIVAVGAAVIVVGGVAFSGGAADSPQDRTGSTRVAGSGSVATR